MKIHSPVRTRVLLVLLAAAGFSALTACVPLVLGGAVATGTVVATDRRTSGTVVEDNGIALKAGTVSYTHLTLPTTSRV